LDLAIGDGMNETLSVLLGAIPPVMLSPTNLTFGTQLIQTRSDPQSVTLTNIGAETLNITKVAASYNFHQTNDCPKSVPPSGQCTINVTFNPHGRGMTKGMVTITDNAPTSPQTVPLKGVGTAVSLQPPSLDFGAQKVGTTSPPQDVTLTNRGIAPVNINRINITGKNHSYFAQTNTCGTSVPPGGSCTLSVTFTPQTRGSHKSATLNVYDNGGGSPQTVVLSGHGTP
jgi:Abnormal spindle-like microcephaly-assoc'd, ASPM-SPD-2-Hydin